MRSARVEAEHSISLTAATAERTWQALAHYQRARIACADRDKGHAEREIRLALTLVQNYEIPLAAWRVHALAAEVFDDSSHRNHAEEVIHRLAGSLPDRDQLKETFLSSALAMRHTSRGRSARVLS